MIPCVASNPPARIVMSRLLERCSNVKTQRIKSAKTWEEGSLSEPTHFHVPAGLEASFPVGAVYGLMTDGFL